MTSSDYREYHVREAARLRTIAATLTTPVLKRQLLQRALEHDRLAILNSSGPAGLENAAGEGEDCRPT